MLTRITRQGKRVEIISEAELRDPCVAGDYVRAYCHIHGSDHQRSLSIQRATGWGHCFNASCQATVLVAEWNRKAAAQLTRFSESSAYTATGLQNVPPARQLMLIPPPKEIPLWQQEEVALLHSLRRHLRFSLLASSRAQTYLRTRGIALDTALAAGVGYLSPEVLAHLAPQKRRLLNRWQERIVFPLVSPEDQGYIGRSLSGWRPGMDEAQHKILLDRNRQARRWIKTNPAGWFSSPLEHLAERVILVEGGFDRLALLQAGFALNEVIALAGTAAHVAWLPPHVRSVVLALDGDEGGQEAARKLADQFSQDGLFVRICTPSPDRWGKDWNERWHSLGSQSILPLFSAYNSLPLRTRSA